MHATHLSYVPGTMSILWYVIWEIFVYESPAVHPTISENERNYIEYSIADHKIEVTVCLMMASKICVHENPLDTLLMQHFVWMIFQNDCPPWGKILTSAPVWGINIGHFGACWGYYTLFTEMPTFLKDILHFDIKHVS